MLLWLYIYLICDGGGFFVFNKVVFVYLLVGV